MNENQRTVTLPTIPKEVARTIENLRHHRGFTDGGIISVATRTGGGISEASRTLQTVPLDVLIAALVNGYVVEKSAEELAREKNRHTYECRSFAPIRPIEQAFIDGMTHTLNTLGIKIEGVNA